MDPCLLALEMDVARDGGWWSWFIFKSVHVTSHQTTEMSAITCRAIIVERLTVAKKTEGLDPRLGYQPQEVPGDVHAGIFRFDRSSYAIFTSNPSPTPVSTSRATVQLRTPNRLRWMSGGRTGRHGCLEQIKVFLDYVA